MVNCSKLKILVLSDIHLFHDKTPTAHIVNNLINTLPNNDSMSDVDMIIISGDLFDRAVSLPNINVWHAYRFVTHLVKLCEDRDIVLRVLEGTPSHDWMQSQMLTSIVKERESKCDAKHVSILSIEHIERFGLDVLYVPDEWGNGCASTFEEVKVLLAQRGLEKVDIAVMHGCFDYQFPINLVGKPDTHKENDYLGITEHVVVIGHYHTSSQFERIYVPGSFDRLRHNEEEPKGHLVVELFKDNKPKVTFIENKNAMKYITLNVTGLTINEVLNEINNIVGANVKEQFIRLRCDKEDAIYNGLTELKTLYPEVHFSITLNKTAKVKETIAETKDIVKPAAITLLNIESLLQERLLSKFPDKVVDCMNVLKEVIGDES